MNAPRTHELRAAGAPDPVDLHFVICEEDAGNHDAIDALTREASRTQALSQPAGHLIVRGLRDAGALALSLVATIDGQVIGHAAFCPVQIDGAAGAWWGLGPITVSPAQRRRGVGSALVRSGLRRLAARGVAGCVVAGDSAFCRRFGFGPAGGLTGPGPRDGRFMAWAVSGELPTGRVSHHAAFDGPTP